MKKLLGRKIPGQIEHELCSRKQLKSRLALEGILVGAVVGVVIVSVRLVLEQLQELSSHWLELASKSWVGITIAVLGAVIIAIFSGVLLRFEPMISGSGIPQVAGIISGMLKLSWQRVLPAKIVGGFLTLGSGLTLGREGPSVQIGAACGEAVASLLRRPTIEHKYLLSTGAASGLAAAFSAPVAGIVFALEEVHRNFSALALISAMTGAITADFITKNIFGLRPELHFNLTGHFPLHRYFYIVLLGVLVGLSAIAFNRLIIWGKRAYDKLKLPIFLKTIIPFVATVILVCWHLPLFGSGQTLIGAAVLGKLTLSQQIFYYGVKFVLLILAFCSGLPGGIFFPLLVLGSLVGDIFGTVLVQMNLLAAEHVIFLISFAMAGHFAGIVRAPVTGILLICEMTGTFEHLLPLALVSVVSYLTVEFFNLEPIYESLLELILEKKRNAQELGHVGANTTLTEKADHGESERQDVPEATKLQLKTNTLVGTAINTDNQTADSQIAKAQLLIKNRKRLLLEYAVVHNSLADNKCIKDIAWPSHLLIVAIKRGGAELIPKGENVLKGGDYLVVLISEEDQSRIDLSLKNICCVESLDEN